MRRRIPPLIVLAAIGVLTASACGGKTQHEQDAATGGSAPAMASGGGGVGAVAGSPELAAGAPPTGPFCSNGCRHGGSCLEWGSYSSCECSGIEEFPCLSVRLRGLGRAADAMRTEWWALSGDGRVAVGTVLDRSGDAPDRPARWTLADGVQLDELTPEVADVSAFDTNSDGSVIVGAVTFDAGRPGYVATDAEVHVFEDGVNVNAVNDDGRVAVGSRLDANGRRRAFVWSLDDGFGYLDLPGDASARAVNADGSVVAGVVTRDGETVPYRWTAELGVEELSMLANTSNPAVTAISADGSVVAGSLQWAGREEHAVLWVEGAPEVLEGQFALSTVRDLSADGRVAVGLCARWGSADTEAWLWSRESGSALLSDRLSERDANLWKWTLAEIRAVSSDGTVLLGHGAYWGIQQEFVAWLGDEPPTPEE
jgi:uncharacterized membrane protein